MKKQWMGNHVEASRLILGMMRHGTLSTKDFDAYMSTALDLDINVVDHADIYGAGGSEIQFGQWLKRNRGFRDRLVIQSKCGICDGYYDNSEAHIIGSVEGILKRLQIDTLDVLMLHRPDALMEPEAIGSALSRLIRQGKVRHFGVSNMHPMQIERIQGCVDVPIIVNQVQFGLKHTSLIDTGFQVNTKMSGAPSSSGYLLEYSQLKNITLQAWSPLQYGFFDGHFINHPDFEDLNRALQAAAYQYGVSKEAIAVAWILRHPAQIQVVLGTTNKDRLETIEKATHITLERETWYGLYRAAGNVLP